MGDEFISTTPERENDEFIKSSVDDLVPIPMESEVTSGCDDLECDMHVNTPLPTTHVREEDFDINSPIGEYVVDFLMENVDVADLPRHLVKQIFSHLLKNLSLTKGMSDEPLGPFNGGNCPGCSSVGSENEFIYDPNPYSYNETPDLFNQPPHHQYETYSCELCGDNPHYGFDCQTQTPLIYQQDPCNNRNYSNDQSPYHSTSLPQQFCCCEICEGPYYSSDCQTRNPLVYEPNPCNNYDFPYFDQPPQFTPPQPPLLRYRKVP
nr:hypothetical protein [Tanacetum cinerariifolium]